MAKIEITQKQGENYNRMLRALRQIANDYQTPTQLRKESRGNWGLDFEESIEMAYETTAYLEAYPIWLICVINMNCSQMYNPLTTK